MIPTPCSIGFKLCTTIQLLHKAKSQYWTQHITRLNFIVCPPIRPRWSYLLVARSETLSGSMSSIGYIDSGAGECKRILRDASCELGTGTGHRDSFIPGHLSRDEGFIKIEERMQSTAHFWSCQSSLNLVRSCRMSPRIRIADGFASRMICVCVGTVQVSIRMGSK